MRRFDAIVFDMDGVLIDSEPLHFAALHALLREDGFVLTREENEDFFGATSEATFRTLIARHGLPRTVAEYMVRYDAAVLSVLSEPHEAAPGVHALIDCARAHAMKLAVASSSRLSWISATLRSLGLSGAFDAIVSGDDVAHSKPSPEIYLLAAARLSLPSSRCLAIEDSPNGVASAVAAGLSVLGVRTAYTAHLRLDSVLQTVDSLAEVDLHRLLTA